LAKAQGRLRGKRPKLNPRQKAHLVSLYRQGEHSTAELADLFGVTRSTVHRALQREQIQGVARRRTTAHEVNTRQ
jgi:DNA invertase Pin-like site-specific DNA recombinase